MVKSTMTETVPYSCGIGKMQMWYPNLALVELETQSFTVI